MRLLLSVLVVLLLPGRIFAQPQVGELEERLGTATGRERLELLVQLTTATRKQDPAAAVLRGQEALALLESDPDDRLKLELLNSLCFAHLHQTGYRECLPYALEAEQLARSLDDPAALAEALAGLGRAYQKLTETGKAMDRYREAISIYEQLDDAAGIAFALDGRCSVYMNRGDFTRGLEDCFRAHDIFEQLGDRNGLTETLNDIGLAYWRLEQPDEALRTYERALTLQQPDGNKVLISRLLNNIGLIHGARGDHQLSLDYFTRSLKIKKEIGDTVGVARRHSNIGFVHLQLGDPEQARQHFLQSLETARGIGFHRGIIYALEGLATVHRERGELSAAIAHTEEALEIGRQTDEPSNIQEIHLSLSELYAEAGRHRSALAAFREYERINRELFDRRNSQAIAEMQARFENEQKQKEIEILEQRQALADLEIARQRNVRQAMVIGFALILAVLLLLFNRYRLKARADQIAERERLLAGREHLLTERERLVDELEARNADLARFNYTVSHDLRSPLVTIKNFLGLLRLDVESGREERLHHDLDRLQTAADRLHRLLDELFELSRVGIQTNPPEEVPFTELVMAAVYALGEALDERGVEVEVPAHLPVVSGDRERLQEMVRHLLDNALRYLGDQESPRIEVGVRAGETPDEEVFYVRDNGIGIEPRYQDKIFGLFERLDPEGSEGTGIGLALVKRIVEVHGGRIWVESEGPGTGSTLCFTLARIGPGGDRRL